jgi:hypothetical protein
MCGDGSTELAEAELDRDGSDALQPEGLLGEALAAGNVGIWSWHLPTDTFGADAVARQLWSLPERGKVSADEVLSALHPGDIAAFRAAAVTARATGAFHAVFRRRR